MEITKLIQNLPYELKEYIIIKGGLELACIIGNKYIIKQILKEYQSHSEQYNLLIKEPSFVLNFLFNNKLIKIDKMYTIPYYLEEIINDCVLNNDLDKLILLDNLCYNNSSISCNAYYYAVEYNYHNVVEWINKHKPIEFIGSRLSAFN